MPPGPLPMTSPFIQEQGTGLQNVSTDILFMCPSLPILLLLRPFRPTITSDFLPTGYFGNLLCFLNFTYLLSKAKESKSRTPLIEPFVG